MLLNISLFKNLKNVFIVIGALWFLIVAVNCITYYFIAKKHVYSNALEEARESFENDVILREWISKLGGVYVPVSDYIKPNPYLKIPRRDVITNKGETLTLLNPAYVTRLLHQFEHKKDNNTLSHITSLNPVNPNNRPKNWEEKALKSIENGKSEYKEIADKKGKTVFRYMAPLEVKETCLKCHGKEGYKIGGRYYETGDIRGGISVTLDFAPYRAILLREMTQFIIPSGALCLIGFLALFGFYRVIRKQKRETENERDKYRALFENSPLGICHYNKSGNILECNKAFADLMGSTEKAITQLNIHEINHEKLIKAFRDSTLHGNGFAEGWYTSVTGNKSIYAKASFKGIEGENGGIESGIAVVEDNTESYYKGKDLERLATIVKDSINEIYVFNPDTFKIIDANRSAVENIGYSLDELRRMTPLDLKPDIDKDDFEQIITPLKNGEKDEVVLNTYHYRKNGSKYPIEAHIQLMSLESPVFVSFAYDVTLRLQTEEKFQNIFNFIDDPIRIIDTEGNILNTNRKGLEHYGYSFEEITKMNIKDIRASEYSQNVEKDIAEIIEKGSGIYQLEHKRNDGTVFPVEINATYIRYEGKPAILTVIRDVSERVKRLREIRNLNYSLTTIHDLEKILLNERDCSSLCREVTKFLVENKNCKTAEIYLYSDGEITDIFSFGNFENPTTLENLESKNLLFNCFSALKEDNEVMVINRGASICKGCIEEDLILSTSVLVARLGYEDTHFGYIKLGLPEMSEFSRESYDTFIRLLKELIPDLSHSLYRISIREKQDLLIQELFHRTRNSMQLVSSMLTMKSNYTDNEELLTAFRSIESKIHSIATAHKKLYDEGKLNFLKMDSYLTELLHNISESYNLNSEGLVSVDLSKDNISIDTAVPAGIVFAEIFTFIFETLPEDAQIKIKSFNSGDSEIGVSIVLFSGKSKQIYPMITDTFGLEIQIIESVVSGQLNGELSIEDKPDSLDFYFTFSTSMGRERI